MEAQEASRCLPAPLGGVSLDGNGEGGLHTCTAQWLVRQEPLVGSKDEVQVRVQNKALSHLTRLLSPVSGPSSASHVEVWARHWGHFNSPHTFHYSSACGLCQA